MKSFLRGLAARIGSIGYRIWGIEPIWYFVFNATARCRWKRAALALTPAEERVVRDIREHGIAVAHIEDFFPPSVFAALRAYAMGRYRDPLVVAERTRRLGGGSREGIKKSFLLELWDGPHVLDRAHPFIRFSVAEALLRIAAAYLRMFPKFRAWRLEATLPTPPRERARSSQRWHRDEEDRRLIKVFLYLNDVDASAGPFTYLKHSQFGGKWAHLFPAVPPRGSLPMPPHEDAFIPRDDVFVATGRAGTMIFCDTTGLHKGGLATARDRLMYTSVYTSPASPWPIRYAYPPGFRPDGLTALAAFAVANNPRQREPRFYR